MVGQVVPAGDQQEVGQKGRGKIKGGRWRTRAVSLLSSQGRLSGSEAGGPGGERGGVSSTSPPGGL